MAVRLFRYGHQGIQWTFLCLLLFLAQQLAEWVGATELRAVGDGETIYQHFQNRKTIETSYDTLWLESGGQVSAKDGCFDLPLRFVEKRREDIKVNKRRLYEKRYALLREVAAAARLGWEAALAAPESEVTTADSD